ncbi:MAG: class I fructose-bisphosphate aldolase [Acidimicrobiia bacterium]
MTAMRETARAMVAPGKGILAADESSGTIKKRLDSINVESTEENRRTYRGLLFTTDGAEKFISGVIMFDETIRQATADGTPFPEILSRKGIIPGIKVDTRAHPLPGSPGEVVTEGLDGLRGRLTEYRELGALFAKWRAVIDIADGIPTTNAVRANAHALARYAALCQEQSIVPIVEPEVLMDGAHGIERCYEVTHWTLRTVFSELATAGVGFDEMVLKPNMVIPGKKSPQPASAENIAEMTIDCFHEVVPAAVPGIAFLSGGQSEEEATANLNAMNRLGPQPWELSFSYGRALQQSALRAWAGREDQLEAAQRAFYHRAKMNGLARSGSYTPDMEKELAA